MDTYTLQRMEKYFYVTGEKGLLIRLFTSKRKAAKYRAKTLQGVGTIEPLHVNSKWLHQQLSEANN